MFRITRPSTGELERLLTAARETEPTYPHLGATASEDLPSGYNHAPHHLVLGPTALFDRARDGLKTWQAHRGAGLEVHPGAEPAEGHTVLVTTRIGLLWVVAPCRVIYTVDEPDRFGFAYGTLPGHPETGEESFMVERREDVTVVSNEAFSRPADVLARAGGPITRALQLQATRRYLAALAEYVRHQE
jgi:uncharacterized protein (UPF0548 family)